MQNDWYILNTPYTVLNTIPIIAAVVSVENNYAPAVYCLRWLAKATSQE